MAIRLLFGLLLFVSTLCFATDGSITFSGRIVEPTCAVQLDAANYPSLNQCSAHTAATTIIRTQIMTPTPHMQVWRANSVIQPDLPVTQWKVIQLSYL